MRKLQALVSFVLSKNWVEPEKIKTAFVPIDHDPVMYRVSDDVMCTYDEVYSVIISIERFPITHQPEKVFSSLAIWLDEFDPHAYRYKINRADGRLVSLDKPSTNIVINDSSTIELEYIVDFREPVFFIKDENGDEVIHGHKYRLADSNNPAEQFEQFYILSVDYDDHNWRFGITS